jgi:hypothetical protein
MTDAEIETLVARFERCEVSHAEWRHREHLLVALAYIARLGAEAGGARFCDGLRRLNASHGTPELLDRGYHETITFFFIRKIGAIVAAAPPGAPLAALAADVIGALGDFRGAVRLHYSRERIMSWEAKRGWVEPDLAPL